MGSLPIQNGVPTPTPTPTPAAPGPEYLANGEPEGIAETPAPEYLATPVIS